MPHEETHRALPYPRKASGAQSGGRKTHSGAPGMDRVGSQNVSRLGLRALSAANARVLDALVLTAHDAANPLMVGE
jgi:hypothetical protein